MGLSWLLRQEDKVAVPTFTDFRLTGAVSSYTPAAPLHTDRSMRAATVGHRLAAQPSGCAIGFPASSAAPAHIRQIGAG